VVKFSKAEALAQSKFSFVDTGQWDLSLTAKVIFFFPFVGNI